MVLNGGMTETGSRSHDHGRSPWHTRSKRFTLAAIAALGLAAVGCDGGSTDNDGDADGGMTDSEWCAEIYPRHPDCLAEALGIDDTVEARRELYLTWTHRCDATGGVFRNCVNTG
jgi:hypothetical protein